jgi:hypothetical protein
MLGEFSVLGSVRTLRSLAASASRPKAASEVTERSIDEGRDVDMLPGPLAAELMLSEDPETVLCTCGHVLEHHDARALRYCRATVSNDHLRRCICVAPTAKSAGRR